jgi:DNA polymerase-3 subunit gamma/tau
MLDELKAHLEEMLRGFRSGVAVYEEHLVEALAKLERAAAQLVTPAAPAAQDINPPVPNQPAAAATGETAGPQVGAGPEPTELAPALTSGTVTEPANGATAAEPSAAIAPAVPEAPAEPAPASTTEADQAAAIA